MIVQVINAYLSSPFTPASLFPGGVEGGWWDPSDISTLFQDTGATNPVTTTGQSVKRMNDKSGNGHNLSQGTTANAPTYQVDGSGFPYLLFDGSNDNMNTATWTLSSFPFDRITALQSVSWTNGDLVWRWGTGNRGDLAQSISSPNLRILDGSTTNNIMDGSLAVGSNGVVTERHIAAASQIAINNGSYTTGDAGSSTPGASVLELGGTTTGSSAGNIRFYGSVLYVGTLSGTDIANLRTYLGNKCGLSL